MLHVNEHCTNNINSNFLINADRIVLLCIRGSKIPNYSNIVFPQITIHWDDEIEWYVVYFTQLSPSHFSLLRFTYVTVNVRNGWRMSRWAFVTVDGTTCGCCIRRMHFGWCYYQRMLLPADGLSGESYLLGVYELVCVSCTFGAAL